MDFSMCLMYLKAGKLLRRKNWNAPGQFVYWVDGSVFNVNRAPLNKIYPEGTEITYCPHIDLRNAQGHCVVWAPSMGDLTANDWEIVPQHQWPLNEPYKPDDHQ